MAHFKISNIPQYLNFDDEDAAMRPEDARDLLNYRHSISSSARQNTGTNVPGSVSVTFDLGSDRHRCIGRVKDLKNHTIIYFLWCSDPSKHKIMRFHRRKTDTANPYGTIEKVIEYAFGWTQRTRITAVDLVQDDDSELCYWEDNVGPRKINLTKASVLNKARTWNLYVPKTDIFRAMLSVNVQALTDTFADITPLGTSRFTLFAGGGGNEAALQSIAEHINSVSGAIIQAKACACHMEISTTDSRVQRIRFGVTEIFGNSLPTLVVPENWYGADLIDSMFYQGKNPPQFPPEVGYGQDASTKSNSVKNQVWQFRLFAHYDDNEKSVLSPISLIPINNILFNQVAVDRLNYINIDFNNAALLDPKVLVTLKYVSVCCRKTNEGVWQEVTKLSVCDYFDYKPSFTFNKAIARYKFFNNNVLQAIAEADVNLLYDDLPLTSRGQRFFGNRLVKGGIRKGMDKPECIDLRVEPDLQPDPTPATYEVTFFIRVLTEQLDAYIWTNIIDVTAHNKSPDIYEVRGPILHNKGRNATLAGGDHPFFGGLLFGVDGDTHLVSNMEGKYEQVLPEGGWYCYAAGTDYGALSKQIDIGLPVDENGALLICSTPGDVNMDMVKNIGAYLDRAVSPPRDLYSVVKIRVPNGNYTFRLASHWCSFGDKLGKGKIYDLNNGRACHKTSTMVWGVKNSNGFWSAGHEIAVTVNGADMFGGEFIVKDLSRVDSDNNDVVIPVVGYLYDANGSVDVDVVAEQGVPVHRAYCTWNGFGTRTINGIMVTIGHQQNERRICFTDHNGFFYFSADIINHWAFRAFQVGTPAGLLVDSTIIAYAENAQYISLYGQVFPELRAGSGVYQMNPAARNSLQDLFDKTLIGPPALDLSLNRLYQLLVCTNNTKARDRCSTIVTGTLKDNNGFPLQGVNVIVEGGGEGISDENGQYRIVVWGDMIGRFTNLPENNNERWAVLRWKVPAPFFPDYGPSDGILIWVSRLGGNTGTTGPPYSPTAVYNIDSFLGTHKVIRFFTPIIYKAWKRGGDYTPGIVYYDEMMRQTTVAWNESAKVHIPFITETANRGPALLKWSLFHQPPKSAHFYQLVMRRDSVHGQYLTWVINDAIYISSGEPVTQNGVTVFDYAVSAFGKTDADMVLLDIANIVDYAKKNLDTSITYQWKKGDRIRLISNEKKQGLNGYFDYEVISFQQPSYLVIRNNYSLSEIKAGFLAQVYSPLLQAQDEFFFERSEMFPCTAPGTDSNSHSVTSGTFRGGDTWWRNRTIAVRSDIRNINTVYEHYMECNNISDVYESKDEDLGRPQIADNSGFAEHPALMQVSDNLILNSKINGLCRWRSVNFKELDIKDGWITDIKSPGEVLHVTQESGIVSNYIGRVQLRDAAGASLLSIAEQYFGTSNRLQNEYGSTFPGSINQNEEYVYGVDTLRGKVWRRANNGLFAISDYKARTFFGKYADRRVWDICSCYHKKTEQYIVTIWDAITVNMRVFSFPLQGVNLIYQGTPIGSSVPVTIFDYVEIEYTDRATNSKVVRTVKVKGTSSLSDPGNFTISISTFEEAGLVQNVNLNVNDAVKLSFRGFADTIAFCEHPNYQEGKRWVTRYSFTPEEYGEVGDEIVSFENGQLWLHEKNAVRNNFFGRQYTTMINTIFYNSQDVKMWMAIFLDSIQSNGGNDWSAPAVTNKNGQSSSIEKASFVKKEQYWHSDFKRDVNTAGVQFPIVNGKVLRSSELSVLLENDFTGEVTIRSVNSLIEASERNVK